MKKLLATTWFKIIAFGIIIGAVLIMLDNQFNFFDAKSEESGDYRGPVTVDKDKAYFTQASLNETTVDFGKVKEGDTLSHVFKISNTGNEPLVIYKTSGSCDCVAAVVTKEMIPPGKEVDITAYFNTKGRKGPQNKTLELTCNTDPAQLLITLKADVE
jgi:Protein of unknown function (DUF1573)